MNLQPLLQWSRAHSRCLLRSVLALLLCLLLAASTLASAVLHCPNTTAHTSYIYVDADDTPDSVCAKLGKPWGWPVLMLAEYRVRTGRYAVAPGERILPVFRRLRRGQQEPLTLVVPSVRTTERLAQVVGERLMMDGNELTRLLADSSFCAQWAHTPATIPALFVPNTYQVYWDMSVSAFMRRMQREWDVFWTPQRRAQAAQLQLTPIQVATLASIVDEETAYTPEKPTIAGLYLNRLSRGMLLQADPTVKFAKGDFAARRIYKADLATPSPYNTYIHPGLPPGPICIPSISGIDAVLRRHEHSYLYMCANEDFSGTHRFASSYAQHLRNARRYAQALNKRKIK